MFIIPAPSDYQDTLETVFQCGFYRFADEVAACNAAVEGEGHVPLNEALAVVSEGQQEAAAALFAAHSLLKPDSVHQRGIAHRLDYPGGSDYGDTALYAHSRVVRSGSQLSAIRHGNNNAESSVIVACLRNIRDRRGYHLSRH